MGKPDDFTPVPQSLGNIFAWRMLLYLPWICFAFFAKLESKTLTFCGTLIQVKKHPSVHCIYIASTILCVGGHYEFFSGDSVVCTCTRLDTLWVWSTNISDQTETNMSRSYGEGWRTKWTRSPNTPTIPSTIITRHMISRPWCITNPRWASSYWLFTLCYSQWVALRLCVGPMGIRYIHCPQVWIAFQYTGMLFEQINSCFEPTIEGIWLNVLFTYKMFGHVILILGLEQLFTCSTYV